MRRTRDVTRFYALFFVSTVRARRRFFEGPGRREAAGREHRACDRQWLNMALRSASPGRATSPRSGVPYRQNQRRENRRERRRDERAQLAHWKRCCEYLRL